MAGIAGDLFLKLYLVILVSGKLALRGWFGILKTLQDGVILLLRQKNPCHFSFHF